MKKKKTRYLLIEFCDIETAMKCIDLIEKEGFGPRGIAYQVICRLIKRVDEEPGIYIIWNGSEEKLCRYKIVIEDKRRKNYKNLIRGLQKLQVTFLEEKE
jgi:hypothetical protein